MKTLSQRGAEPRARWLALSRGKAGAGSFTAAILLTLAFGVAGCNTDDNPECAVITDQGNGTGGSQTRIIRYPDGHKIITRDGQNTDITIQRRPGSAPGDADASVPCEENSRFDPPSMQERFRSDSGNAESEKSDADSAREAFRQRMIDRMGGYP